MGVIAITQPAGMPKSTVLTMVQLQPVFSSWKPSMTTEVPKVVMSTSKLLESLLVIPSQSIWPDSLAKTSLVHSVIFSKSQSPNNQEKQKHSTCGHHQSPTKKP